MKNGFKLAVIGILSLFIGSIFASPLLVAELSEIRPYKDPLPKGVTADIDVNVVYVNFSVGETYEDKEYGNLTDFSYFVVLNITNNCSYWAKIDMLQFAAAKNITKGLAAESIFFGENGFSSTAWESKGAWVDDVWYNVTWVPHDNFWMNCSTLIHGYDMWGKGLTKSEGYWMEGVQLMDKGVGENVTNIYMNMNGTWVDVTGRVKWLDDNGSVVDINPKRLPSHSMQPVTTSGTLFMEHKLFGPGSMSVPERNVGSSITTAAPVEFNYLWAPCQSRLIVLSSDLEIPTKFIDALKIEHIRTKPLAFRGSVHSKLNGTTGLWNSWAVDDEVKQVQMMLTEDGYIYNPILSDDQMFVMDEFGVEVFIEPRN